MKINLKVDLYYVDLLIYKAQKNPMHRFMTNKFRSIDLEGIVIALALDKNRSGLHLMDT